MTPSENGKAPTTDQNGQTRPRTIGRRVVHAYLQSLGVFVGSSLVLVGLARRSLGGLVLAAGGAALVSKTVSGVWLPRPRRDKPAEPSAKRTGAEPEDATAVDLVDQAGYDSFPASDAPAYSPR